jgi:hypothetical protein
MNPIEIEEIKKEIVLKELEGGLLFEDVVSLPVNDEIRTFICLFNPIYSRWYAQFVDKGPGDETRKASCRSPEQAYGYAVLVDRRARPDTREGTCKDSYWEQRYRYAFNKFPRGIE